MNEFEGREVIIIDGSAIARKCFHAVTSDKKDQKIYENNDFSYKKFLNCLFSGIKKIMKTKRYFRKIIVFDRRGGDNFRKKIFPEYKANRKKVDESFYYWIEKSKSLLKRYLGLEIYVSENGYEGDDQIGTIAKKFSEKFCYVDIFTIDSDFLQLVDEFISVHLFKKSFIKISYNLENFSKLTDGLLPHQFPLFKALSGDSSDNYPGIPNIGKKTAINLIKQFGSEDNFLKNYQNIKDWRIKTSISENIEKLKIYLEIAKIKTNLFFPL
ncbi:5'-3' exonuclease H3TH domain-containing protein [Mycoplasma suis]|uniref:5'-3' exonuclease n=1 Tax=Mycoplasma suis (strain Illinois) TaxID=768700 RepID=F0QQQ0_MYCSL|nr:5'-3' exonuclease H3TH domain-containing protein [Mycoplasma suis]ADX97820.1 5'-3' exonuclease, DNA polymerase I-like protein [Mycoplasma suis str. Illinois]